MASYNLFIIMFLVIFLIMRSKKRKNAVILNHRRNHKCKEILKMKKLAQKFIGKDCLIYTILSNTESIKGVITEITDSGLLVEYDGNLQAVNLEYIIRIREWPRNKKGKKKTVFEL